MKNREKWRTYRETERKAVKPCETRSNRESWVVCSFLHLIQTICFDFTNTRYVIAGKFFAKSHGRYRCHIWVQYGPYVTILMFFVYVRNMFHLHPPYADLEISLYIWVRMKTIPWRFRILNPKNARVIYL